MSALLLATLGWHRHNRAVEADDVLIDANKLDVDVFSRDADGQRWNQVHWPRISPLTRSFKLLRATVQFVSGIAIQTLIG